MKSAVLCTFLLSTVSTIVLAQGHGAGKSNGSVSTLPSNIPTTNPNLSTQGIFVSGKVVLADGSQLSEPAAVETICRGERHTEGYTDSRGNFSFRFGDPSSSLDDVMADASDDSGMFGRKGANFRRNSRDCQLQAELAGFTSDTVELSSRIDMQESVDLGKITLHRMEHVEGTSISVTTVLAPKEAKKALQKAREQEKKGKWDEAEKSLQKAVQIYPKYAVAWNELGQVQLQKKDALSAKKSFEQSVAADPKYVNPYEGLSHLAMQAENWPQVVETTNKLLALNPINFPAAYLFNAVANDNLRDLDSAEKSARQGIRVDDQHRLPKLEYVLGFILMQKREYPEAAQHMQAFLALAKDPGDIEMAKKQLSEIGRLSAAANAPTVAGKK